jgi:hypothetical protein
VLALRGLADRLERAVAQELAGVDARGAAGAEDDLAIGSTAAWLRGRLRMGASVASNSVRTARACSAPKRVVPSGRRCALPHTGPLPAGVARDRDPPPSVVTQLGTPGNLTGVLCRGPPLAGPNHSALAGAL